MSQLSSSSYSRLTLELPRTLEEQDLWQTDAAFLNGLVREGFVLLGGTLEGTPDIMLIIRASHVAQIMNRPAKRSLEPQRSPPHHSCLSLEPPPRLTVQPTR